MRTRMHPSHCKSVRVVTHASSITALIARLRLAGRPSRVAETLQHGRPRRWLHGFELSCELTAMDGEPDFWCVTDDGQTDRSMRCIEFEIECAMNAIMRCRPPSFIAWERRAMLLDSSALSLSIPCAVFILSFVLVHTHVDLPVGSSDPLNHHFSILFN